MKTRHVRQTHNALLQKPDIAKEYLNEAIESNDSAVILMALRNIAEAQQDGIYKILSFDGNPEEKIIKRICFALETAKDNALDRYNEHEINITGEPTEKEKHLSKLLLDDFNEAAYLIKLLANKFIKKEDCG